MVGRAERVLYRRMPSHPAIELDALILGGGVAGLWTLDELVRAGHDALLIESGALGGAQTGWSQGIIHGGLKYTLSGLFTESAKAIREMPGVWREHLAGRASPDLSRVRGRSPHCYLWRTDTLASKAGMIGAKLGLRVAPVTLPPEERPAVLRGCPGTVARLDEQVIDPVSLVEELARPHAGRIRRGRCVSLIREGDERVSATVEHPESSDLLKIRARRLILTAGAGNAPLRAMMGLDDSIAQTRPLHMTLVRGPLPELNGHCVDGSRTRVTITSADSASGARLWQIGGQIAEEGVALDAGALIRRCRAELLNVLPGLSLEGCEWSTYRADRAEGRTAGGGRPEDVVIVREGGVITAWPTKLALAPRLAKQTTELVGPASAVRVRSSDFGEWPAAEVGKPVWETARWVADRELE